MKSINDRKFQHCWRIWQDTKQSRHLNKMTMKERRKLPNLLRYMYIKLLLKQTIRTKHVERIVFGYANIKLWALKIS